MDFRKIEYFVKCAQTGSFSKAAEQLYTTQSNVSKVIAGLEAELQTALFERTARGVLLTPRGERVYGYAGKLLEDLNRIRREELPEQAVLRLSSNPSSWFADCFSAFYRRHAAEPVHYEIYSADCQEIAARVNDRTDELGFVFIMKEQLPAFLYFLKRRYLEFSTLGETAISVYLGKKDAARLGQKGRAGQDGEERQSIRLEQLRLIQRYPDEFSPDLSERITDENGGSAADAQAVITTNSDYIMERILELGELSNISFLYFSGTPHRVVAEGIRLEGEQNTVVFGCIRRQDEDLSEWAGRYLEHVKEYIAG